MFIKICPIRHSTQNRRLLAKMLTKFTNLALMYSLSPHKRLIDIKNRFRIVFHLNKEFFHILFQSETSAYYPYRHNGSVFSSVYLLFGRNSAVFRAILVGISVKSPAISPLSSLTFSSAAALPSLYDYNTLIGYVLMLWLLW